MVGLSYPEAVAAGLADSARPVDSVADNETICLAVAVTSRDPPFNVLLTYYAACHRLHPNT